MEQNDDQQKARLGNSGCNAHQISAIRMTPILYDFWGVPKCDKVLTMGRSRPHRANFKRTTMSLAVIHSCALEGLKAPPVTVEVHLANGLPSFTLVGLAETAVRESRERVRAALQTSGLDFPLNKRITVNLAPADLPKEGGRFDLPIALGILAASGQIETAALLNRVFAGELSLSGELRPIRGALAMAAALSRLGPPPSLILPLDSAREAALVPGLALFGANHLREVVTALQTGAADTLQRIPPSPRQPGANRPDLREVRGQAAAKRALEIAAAGGHSLLLVGPPGTGKSMLAQRFGSLLPPLSEAEALESAAILSLNQTFDPGSWGQRVTRSPHHSASSVALVGGGNPPRPGEISLAHHGVLFLDELPEFPRAALEALREPLETGRITLSRAARQAEFPARCQMIAAMNPCPCGYLGSARHRCRCTPEQVHRYQSRISGPLLDRIDLRVEVHDINPDELQAAPNGESSEAVTQRVQVCQQQQLERQGSLNARLEGHALDEQAVPEPAAKHFLGQAGLRLGWSNRSLHRVLRVARTIADLQHSPAITTVHIAEAIQLRRALPG
jgi:magnesium chelatase family protein